MIYSIALQLRQYFALARKRQFTGALRASSPSGETWELYYLMGRLVWASGGRHRLRRWQRLLAPLIQDFNPDWVNIRQQYLSQVWEYRVLLALMKRQKIQQEQAVQVIQQTISEVLFDILQNANQLEMDNSAADLIKGLGKVMVVLNAEERLQDVHRDWETWVRMGLDPYSPNQGPIFTDLQTFEAQVSPETCAKLVKIVQGDRSLREIASRLGVHLPTLTRSLAPFIHRGLICLKDLPDLGVEPVAPSHSPVLEQPLVAGGDRPADPIIVCIDDSPSICQNMHRILTQAKYRCICIQDPLESILTLMDIKPQMIFLDLVMPIANGYEICAQIRRISALKYIPVVILTGNDGIVDRVRAKLVGASDFMSKPIQPTKVLAMVQRYLSQASASQAPAPQASAPQAPAPQTPVSQTPVSQTSSSQASPSLPSSPTAPPLQPQQRPAPPLFDNPFVSLT
ncbi:MAG: response regulator [Synechococcales bacterium]|nr:response regulator [Synechococcales bacterium]